MSKATLLSFFPSISAGPGIDVQFTTTTVILSSKAVFDVNLFDVWLFS